MPAAPHIQKVLDRIGVEADRLRRAAFITHMLRQLAETEEHLASRSTWLASIRCDGFDHDETLAKIRSRLAQDRADRKAGERHLYTLIPAHRWALCGVLIAEGRAKRKLCAIAHRFAPAEAA